MYSQLLGLVPEPNARVDWANLVEQIPSLAELDRCPQDAYWHAEGDVGVHTRMVCDEMVALPGYAAATPERRFVLFYSALLHDISKPAVTKTEDGRITSKGHSLRGATDARILLWRHEVPFELRESICRMIRVHQDPFMIVTRKANPEFVVRKLSHEMNLEELSLVAEADARGRRTNPASVWQETLDAIELFRELAREQNCYTQPYPMADAHTAVTYFRQGPTAEMDPRYPMFQEAGSKVIVLSGLPAAGKDTWVAENGKDLPVISFDDAREELGLKHGKNAGAAVHLAQDRAKELLRAKKPFIWNATHLSQQMRDKTLDMLYAYGAEVEIIYLEQPANVLFSRNDKRDSTLPNKVLETMLFKWEVPLPTEVHAIRYEVPQPATKSRLRLR